MEEKNAAGERLPEKTDCLKTQNYLKNLKILTIT